MAGKGTAGLGLVVAAALVIFAVFAPGTPERPEPAQTDASASALLAQRAAYGAALGGHRAASSALPPALSQEEIERLIGEYLADASEEVQAQVAALLPQYVAGAQADIQAQIGRLAARFTGGGVTADQLLAALRNAVPAAVAGQRSAGQLEKHLTPQVKAALDEAAAKAAARPAQGPPPPAAPAKAPSQDFAPALGFGDSGPADQSDLRAGMSEMASELDGMDMGSTDLD